jgi:diguanylate cyclase (GGDEF)-like protein/PAS domain S-box-containing protein
MADLIRILLLEDDPLDAELNERALRNGDLEFETRCVADETGFCLALSEFAPDLVLSELSLPAYDGFKALQATQEHDPKLPFIFVSGAIGEETATQILQRGAVDYILKDRLARLPDAVKRAVADVRHQRRLSVSEQRFRMLTESSMYGIWDWDLEQDTLFLSSQWKAQLGYADDELQNEYATFAGLVHPEDWRWLEASIRDFLQTPGYWDHEFRMRHKDGDYRWIAARASHMVNQQGQVSRMLGVHIDITRHQQRQEQLRMFQRIVSNSRDLMAFIDRDCRYQLVNEACAAAYGKPMDQIVGHSVAELVGEADFSQRVKPRLERALAGENVSFQDWFTVGGDRRFFDVAYTPNRNERGEMTGIVAAIRDITQYRKAQEKIRQAAQVFKSTIEGVTITDLKGRILDVNPSFCDITGYPREAVIGKNPSILQSGRHDRSFYRALWQSLVQTGRWSGEIWNRRANGFVYPELLTISTVKDEQGNPSGYVGVFTDITATKRNEERLEFLAHHDPLTRLPNRLLFNARLDQAIRHSRREHQKLAVFFIDLDRFKNINDSLGHQAGDELLRLVSQRLKQSVREEDTVARISGDEFVILLENLDKANAANQVLGKVMDSFRSPFVVRQSEVIVTCSVGVSIYPEDGSNGDDLMRNADAAMYRAKDEGRNTYEYYTPEMTASAFEHVFIETGLHRALAQQELIQVYQPQVDLKKGTIVGCEALVRWQHPEQGRIPPNRFIPIAEQSGLVLEIDNWMLRQACKQARAWCDQGLHMGRIAVNMTGRQVQRRDFARSVLKVVEEYGLGHGLVEIEVTESYVMQRPEVGIQQLKILYDAGIHIAIDDFGTGYSSLNYLRKLPFDKIKLDQSFIQDINRERDSLAIVKAVVMLGNALGKTVIAEGVETEEHAHILNQHGCHQAQGYLFSTPLSADEMRRFLGGSQ